MLCVGCSISAMVAILIFVLSRNTATSICGSYMTKRSETYPAPLILDMHGKGMPAEDEMDTSGYMNIKDAHVVWPDGYKRTWAAGANTYPPATSDGVDHVSCLSDIIRQVKREYNISFVVATGISNGCAMSQRLALETELIDVVACASHGVAVANSSSLSAVDFMLVMGDLDHIWLNGVPNTLRLWSERNQCNGSSTHDTGEGVRQIYACKHGRLEYLLLSDVGHFIYNQAKHTMSFINARR